MVYGENSLCDPVAAGLVVEAMLGKVVATDPTKGHPANYRFFQALGKLHSRWPGELARQILQGTSDAFGKTLAAFVVGLAVVAK